MSTGDSVLGWPLSGVHRVEASAGTGKTFALTLLHTRLIVERALSARQILAVTYTIAATQELRERLRVQLGRAAALALLAPDALAAACASADAAEAATAAALTRQLRTEPAPALAARLRRAVGEVDLAAIFTIHAFCQRILSEHALAGGEPLLPRAILASERAIDTEVALDVWRRWTRARDDVDALCASWLKPDLLARDLPMLVGADVLLPSAAAIADTASGLARAAVALRDAWRSGGGAARTAIERACAAKVFHGGRLRADMVAELWRSLDAFADDATLDAPPTAKLGIFTPAGLLERTNKGRDREVPDLPLCRAIETFVGAWAAEQHSRAQRRANMLHVVRAQASERLAELKQQRGLVGFDDLVGRVHAALTGPGGVQFAEVLRQQYPAALVDEFQDTDPRQWDIFRRIYVGAGESTPPPTLFLIGDPKQAIYRFRGGDMHTYHAAAADAQGTLTLERNFRSRPLLIDAVTAVFAQGGERPFADADTRFPAVTAGGNVADDALVANGVALPALHVWNLPLRESDARKASTNAPAQIKADAARDLAAAATAARIGTLLADAKLQLRDKGGYRCVAPRDIAVLVNRHDEAVRVQRELAARGIASVTAMRASLFATPEAAEILRILEALLANGDEGRLRAALASVLIGADAAAIDALSSDESAHRGWLDAFARWRQRRDRFGPLPFLSELVATAAPRLLALGDGERRLTNYLQLAEQLQEARTGTLGETGQADWLARRIASADNNDETQQLRLESDAERVQIMTLHKAKGLEFGIVFLPFAAFPPADATQRGLGFIAQNEDGRRTLRARIEGVDDEAYMQAKRVEQRETLAEHLRLLYVGLTRARHAVWLAAGAVNGAERSGLGWLLHRDAGDSVAAFDTQSVDAALDRLAAAAPQAIVHETFPDLAAAPPVLPATSAADPVPIREARRVLRRDWWVHSFSQLAREEGNAPDRATDDRGAEDEIAEPDAANAIVSAYAGARFGNALHAALENVDFAKWRDWRSETPPAGQQQPLLRALGANGYAGDDVLADGSRLLGQLVRNTLNVRLPEGVRLADLPVDARRNELEFHFALQSVAIARLVELLHRNDVLAERDGFGTRERLEGLMTGRIDLVYQHAGRTYLLDYKSNRLADYSAQGLARAVRDSEYDLQYLIYTLALHRWLRFRRADYDYDAHFGGVRYLFCRGLDAASGDSAGVFVARPSRAFIDELDALLAPPRAEAA